MARATDGLNEIDWQARILFADDEAVVVDKPAGVLSQKDKSGDPDLADLLGAHWRASGENVSFLAPAHRLDRNTSGCLLLARSSAAAAKLAEALRAGLVARTYIAVVKGDPGEAGTIDAPLEKDPDENKTAVSAAGEKAVTHFRRLQKLPATSLVEVKLETGRSHQIRAHFAHIRCPLLGDRKYAKAPWNAVFHRPALHARDLKFPHPTTKREIDCVAPIPADLRALIQQIGGKL